MKYPWIDAYLMAKRGVTKDLQHDWNWIRYHVGGKMFAAICTPGEEHKAYGGHTILSLKCDPLMGELLRSQYEAIRPAFYMDKRHWIAVYLEGNVPDDLLRMLCAQSHQLVFEKLTKKLQRELTEAAEKV